MSILVCSLPNLHTSISEKPAAGLLTPGLRPQAGGDCRAVQRAAAPTVSSCGQRPRLTSPSTSTSSTSRRPARSAAGAGSRSRAVCDTAPAFGDFCGDRCRQDPVPSTVPSCEPFSGGPQYRPQVPGRGLCSLVVPSTVPSPGPWSVFPGGSQYRPQSRAVIFVPWWPQYRPQSRAVIRIPWWPPVPSPAPGRDPCSPVAPSTGPSPGP